MKVQLKELVGTIGIAILISGLVSLIFWNHLPVMGSLVYFH